MMLFTRLNPVGLAFQWVFGLTPAEKPSWLPGWNEPYNALPKILLWPFLPNFCWTGAHLPSSKHYFIR